MTEQQPIKTFLTVKDYTKNNLYCTYPVLNKPDCFMEPLIRKAIPQTIEEINELLFKKKKISSSYFYRLTETLVHICQHLYIHRQLVIPKNSNCYAVLQHEYLSYYTVKDALTILVKMNIIGLKNGNKKLNSYGLMKEGDVFGSAGFTTEIKLLGDTYEYGKLIFTQTEVYREETQLDYEPYNNSQVLITNKEKFKCEFTGKIQVKTKRTKVENHILKNQMDKINNGLRKFGQHYNGEPITYKRIFQKNLNEGGRLYSSFQNVPSNQRHLILPANFIECDYKSSIPTISYLSVTGNKYQGEDIYSDCFSILNPEVLKNEHEKKLYRNAIKQPFLTMLNSIEKSAIESIRFGLSRKGINKNKIYETAEELYGMDKNFIERLLNTTKENILGFNKRLDVASIKIAICHKIEKASSLPYNEVVKLPFVNKLLTTIIKQANLFKKFCKESFVKYTNVTHRLFTPEEIIKSVIQTHSAIKPLFFKPQIGGRLINIESNIIIEVLLQCIEENIEIFVVHDAVYCSKNNKEKVLKIMENALHNVTMSMKFKFIKYLLTLINKFNFSKSINFNKIIDRLTPSLLDIRVGMRLTREEVMKLQGEWDYVAVY